MIAILINRYFKRTDLSSLLTKHCAHLSHASRRLLSSASFVLKVSIPRTSEGKWRTEMHSIIICFNEQIIVNFRIALK